MLHLGNEQKKTKNKWPKKCRHTTNMLTLSEISIRQKGEQYSGKKTNMRTNERTTKTHVNKHKQNK